MLSQTTILFIQVMDSSTSNLQALPITGNLKAFVDKKVLHVPVQNLWQDLNLEGHSLHFTFVSYGRFCFSLILTLCSCACIKSPECWGMLSSNANKAEMYDVKKKSSSF